MDKKKLIVPIVTPFNDDQSVNYEELKRITRGLLDEGADGIFAGGSSAECFMLSEEERRKTLETVIEAADGAYVIAHVGSIGSALTEKLAKHAEQSGANAVASVAPFYFGFSYENIRSYYFDLCDSVKIPTMIYYIPACAKGSLTPAQMAEIMNGRENITSVKYTDSDYFTMQRVKELTGKTGISGKDECFVSAIAMGADGAIGTTFNFLLGHYKKILSLFNQGKNAEALEVQKKANAIIAAMGCGDVFNTTKYLMSLRGYNAGTARKPFIPLTDEQKRTLSEAFGKNQI